MNYPSPDFDPADYIRGQRPSHIASPQPATTATGLLNESDESAVPLEQVHPRQPHLGYTLGILLIGTIVMLLVSLVVLGIGRAMHLLPPLHQLKPNEMPVVTILTEGLSYALTAVLIVPLFRRMWQRPFAEVLRIGLSAARQNIAKLVLLGIVVSVLAQLAQSRMTLPKEMPIDAFFKTRADVWMVALFGTLIAPLAEELFFRGFLFRGLAIAYDWITQPHTPEARNAWHTTDTVSPAAIIVSGVITSILFGALHAAQLGFAWNAVAILSVVGGILTAVRVRFDSVAASSLVHIAYNGFIFAVIFVATDGFRHLDKLHNH